MHHIHLYTNVWRGFARRWRPAVWALLSSCALLLAAAPAVAQRSVQAQQVSASYQHIEGLIGQRQYAQAIEVADQYLARNSRDPQVRFLKGVAQQGQGDVAAALATFTELTQLYPELPEPYNNLATIYAGQGDFDKARAALLLALQANPAYAAAHENLGDVYSQLALQQYRQAQALEPRNAALERKLENHKRAQQP
jgi:Flp pilus assembly protein TadD